MISKGLFGFLALNALILFATSTYIIKENDKVCLLLDISAQVIISYNSTNGTEFVIRQASVNVLSNPEDVFGECMAEAGLIGQEPSAQINLTLPDASSLNVTFVQQVIQEGDSNATYIMLDRLIYQYDTRDNSIYINPVQKDKFTVTIDNMGSKLSHAYDYYTCSADTRVGISRSVYLTIAFVKVQAISFANNTYSDIGEECPTMNMSTTTGLPTTTANMTTTTANMTTTTHMTTTTANITTTTANWTTTTHITTTTANMTTTTANMTTTTGPHPIITTTIHPKTSTKAPITTTPMPRPSSVFYVKDTTTENICLLMNFSATFNIAYTKTDKKPDRASVKFNPVNVLTSGYCLNMTQMISLSWRPTTMPSSVPTDWVVTFYFIKVNNASSSSLHANANGNTSSYALHQIYFQYILDNVTFPHVEGSGTVSVLSPVDDSRFKTQTGKAYHCDANKTVLLKNDSLQMETHNFEVEAFRNSKSITFDGGDVRCAEDQNTPHNAMVPIIVGVVLTLLVIVVLVAYFIGRRRQQQQNNYEQI
jgi:hypothetical protein